MFDVGLNFDEIIHWLREDDANRLDELWQLADELRQRMVGQAVHLRGLVEISNHCARQCGYCGLRAGNHDLTRYRMDEQEILAAAHQAVRLGFGTLVLQAGEDYSITGPWLANVVRRIKQETPLAVTLSMGERSETDLLLWRQAGADRYLLRFETSDRGLFALIHPSLPGRVSDRIAMLRMLRGMGYEVGSGVMIGIPGQTYQSLTEDILLFRELDLDMIGVGPYIPHPATPLANGQWASDLAQGEQVPATELMTYRVVALARLVCPQANIPATSALATINKQNGRELGLQRGANVVMPNLTPVQYRRLYRIYPDKACIDETGEQCNKCLRGRIASIGRTVGVGPGGRVRYSLATAGLRR